MKKHIAAAALVLALAGCSLIPKQVEFFQKDVPNYPAKTAKQIQAERQTAALLADKTRETEEAAAATDAAPEVQQPASEASELAGALSLSLGPPASRWEGEARALARRLEALEAKRDIQLDRLEDKLSKIEDKKVEGTGAFQVPYLLWVAIVGGAVILTLVVVRAAVGIAAVFNPAAALAKTGLDIPIQGFTQLAKAGPKFLKFVDDLDLDEKAKAVVKDLWFRAHKEEQSPEVRKLIEALPSAVKQ